MLGYRRRKSAAAWQDNRCIGRALPYPLLPRKEPYER